MADEKEGTEDTAEAEELKPSELDENTHAELLVLYRDSSNTVRFSKERQWKLVGAVLLIFVSMMFVAQTLIIEADMAKGLVLASFLVSAAAIYMLVVYQIWQGTQFTRQKEISAQFSSLFKNILGQREGRTHGYIILTFMIIGIILGNAATVIFLARFYL